MSFALNAFAQSSTRCRMRASATTSSFADLTQLLHIAKLIRQ
jgi:hypothetical protein